jgi:hypothetical protein
MFRILRNSVTWEYKFMYSNHAFQKYLLHNPSGESLLTSISTMDSHLNSTYVLLEGQSFHRNNNTEHGEKLSSVFTT